MIKKKHNTEITIVTAAVVLTIIAFKGLVLVNKNQIPKTDSEDVTKLYAFKDVAFMFVNHTQTGNEWSGVLAKNKGNGEWTKLLTSPRQTHNPSEMSTRNGKLHLTIEEDSEIHNSLYFFTTDGITWTEENL